MASSSSSSYLSIDDEIRQVQAQIVVVEADIRSKGETLKQSSDEKEKDFLRGEITQLRQEKDRLHQKELLLLQQRPQQQQLEAATTHPYVNCKLAGTRELYHRVNSLKVKEIYAQLCTMYAGRCEGDQLNEVLGIIPIRQSDGSMIMEEKRAFLTEDAILKPGTEVVLVPKIHQVVFTFRTLALDQSLRVLAKTIVSKSSVPVSGKVRRASGIDVEVIVQAPFRKVVEDVYQMFKNPKEYVGAGRSVNIQVSEATYSVLVGELHAHFQVVKYGGDMRRADGLPSDDNAGSDAWSLASDDVAAMYPAMYS